MNRWQVYYRDQIMKDFGRLNEVEREELELLGQLGDAVRVRIPAVVGHPEEVRTFVITYDENDYFHGKLSVFALVSNLRLWISRGGSVWTYNLNREDIGNEG